MTDIPQEEDFDEVEEWIEKYYKTTNNLSDSELWKYCRSEEVGKLIREAMSWAIDQVIPEEKDKCTHKYSQEDGYCHTCFNIKLTQSDKTIGFNACREESLSIKRELGL